MINGKQIVVIMPAYNAAATLKYTYDSLPHDIVDEVILVDDYSDDDTIRIAETLNIKYVIRHDRNSGYGANQKTCYKKAIEIGADVIVMVHPDYQYEPKLVTAMASVVACGVYDCSLGSRILGTGALSGGMPLYKYIANRLLTLLQNIIIPHKLSEYHTGFRAFSRNALQTIPFSNNSDNFIFDNQMLLQVMFHDLRIGEVSCPTKYLSDSSSITLSNAIVYGLGVMKTTLEYKLSKLGLIRSNIF